MKIIQNLENFLKDQEYYIDMYANFIHIYYYEALVTLNANLIELKMSNFSLIIEGEGLVIKNMDNRELLIEGSVNQVRFNR